MGQFQPEVGEITASRREAGIEFVRSAGDRSAEYCSGVAGRFPDLPARAARDLFPEAFDMDEAWLAGGE
jgi:hypothetical protein